MPEAKECPEAILLTFLKEWLAWAENPVPHETFLRNSGLCDALSQWLHTKVCCEWETSREVTRLVPSKFQKSGLHGGYPFNEGRTTSEKMHEFVKECSRREMHKNLRRLAWVRKTIKELEDELN